MVPAIYFIAKSCGRGRWRPLSQRQRRGFIGHASSGPIQCHSRATSRLVFHAPCDAFHPTNRGVKDQRNRTKREPKAGGNADSGSPLRGLPTSDGRTTEVSHDCQLYLIDASMPPPPLLGAVGRLLPGVWCGEQPRQNDRRWCIVHACTPRLAKISYLPSS